MDIYGMRAEIGKALSHPTRLRILELLDEERELCVCHIVDHLSEGQPTISKHLAILRDAELVTKRKDGLQVYYRLRTPCVIKFLTCLDEFLLDRVAKHQDELTKQ